VHLAKGPGRVGEIHQAEGAEHGVERTVGCVQNLPVHLPGEDLPGLSAVGLGVHVGHHLVREVGGEHLAPRPHLPGRREGHEAGAAGHVQHLIEVAQFGPL
jgi:hypothetical protein